MEEYKRCPKCGQAKQKTDEFFYVYFRKRSGRYCFSSYCKECNRSYSVEYKQQNAEKTKQRKSEYNRAYYSKNKERINESGKLWYEKNKDTEHYKELARGHSKQYYDRNKGTERKKRADVLKGQRRRTRKNMLPATLTRDEWTDALHEFDGSCAYCGANGALQQDHFIAVSKGGGYTRDNIIPACRSCNASKNDKPFAEWYRTQSFYDPTREKHILNYIEKVKIQ